MLLSISFGTALAASMVSISLDISTRVARELRSFGANIVVKPALTAYEDIINQRRFLREKDIIKIKTIFWRHNILGILPILYVKDPISGYEVIGTWYKKSLKIPGSETPFVTGISTVMTGWLLKGRWPVKDTEIVAGQETGLKIGQMLNVFGRQMTVVGILKTGSEEDRMLIGELSTVQKLAGLKGKISKVYISALTKPIDEFAYKDPKKMSPREYEKWYCTAYVTSIAKQIEEVMAGAKATPVWPVAQTEGRLLDKLKLLIYLLTAASLGAAAIGVSTTMIMSLLRRTEEIALMKAIGADRAKTIYLFMSEAVIVGFIGGLIGYLISIPLSSYMGLKVFGVAFTQRGLLLPISLFSSIIIATLGAYAPVNKAIKIAPAEVLKSL